MKAVVTSILMAGFISHLAYAGVKIEDLTIHCSGALQIESVVKSHFSPARPPSGRFDGSEASGFVQVSTKIIHLNSVGCQLLETKYGIDLKTSFLANLIVPTPSDLGQVQWIGQAAIGKSVFFNVKQYFGYVSKSPGQTEYLPLHPKIVDETLKFEGAVNFGVSNYQVVVNAPIDLQTIYETTSVKNWTEEKKLKLGAELIHFAGPPGKKTHLNQFDDLFLSLQFSSMSAKKQHFLQLWKVLKLASASDGWTYFFDFQTGGPGAFVGKPYAKKLIALANEVALDSQRMDLVSAYPSLLKADWLGRDCLQFSENEFIQILNEWKENHPSYLNFHRSQIQKILEVTAGDSNFGNDECLKPLRTPQVKELSQVVLKVMSSQ